jgi:hypothetical protein
MRVIIPIDPGGAGANEKAEPLTFWQRIAQFLDRLVVDRSYRAVPTTALGRSRYELNRCRRMLHGAVTPAIASASSHRAVKMVQTQT